MGAAEKFVSPDDPNAAKVRQWGVFGVRNGRVIFMILVLRDGEAHGLLVTWEPSEWEYQVVGQVDDYAVWEQIGCDNIPVEAYNDPQ